MKKRRKRRLPKKEIEHVSRDWLIALTVFFFAVLLIIGVSVLIFMQTNTSDYAAPEDTGESKIIDQALLEETLQFYSTKEERYVQYQNEKPNAPEL